LRKHLQRLAQTVKSCLDVERNGGDALARSGTAVEAVISPNAVSTVQAPPKRVSDGRRSRRLSAPLWAGLAVLCLLVAGGGGAALLYLKFARGQKLNPAAEIAVSPVERKITAVPVDQQTAVAPAPQQTAAAAPAQRQTSTAPAQTAVATVPQQSTAAAPASQPNGPSVASDVRRFDGTWIGTLTCKSTPSGLPGWSYEVVGNVSNGVFHSQRGPEGKPGSETYDGTIEPDGNAAISQTGFSGNSAKDPFHRPPGTEYRNTYIGSFDGSHGQLTRTNRASCTIDFTTLAETQRSVERASPAAPR